MADETEEIAGALYAAIGLFLRRFRQVPTGDGLSLPERSTLSRLERGGASTAADLARAEQISPQALGATLNALEQRGLITRRADPDDGRRTILTVNDAGTQVLRQKRDTRAQQLANALADGFTAHELRTLRTAAPLIERLGESL